MGLEHKINYCRDYINEHCSWEVKRITIETLDKALEKSQNHKLEPTFVNLIYSNLTRRLTEGKPMVLSLSKYCLESNDLKNLLTSFTMIKSESPNLFIKYHDLLGTYYNSSVFDRIYLAFKRIDYQGGADKEGLIDYLGSTSVNYNITKLSNNDVSKMLTDACIHIWDAREAYKRNNLLANEDKELFNLLDCTNNTQTKALIISYYSGNMIKLSHLAKSGNGNVNQRYFQFRTGLLEHQSRIVRIKEFIGKKNFDQITFLALNLDKRYLLREIKFLKEKSYPQDLDLNDLIVYISKIKYNFDNEELKDTLTSPEIKQLVKSYNLAHGILTLNEDEGNKYDWELNEQREIEDEFEHFFTLAINEAISYGDTIEESKKYLIQWSNNLCNLIKNNPSKFLNYYEMNRGDVR